MTDTPDQPFDRYIVLDFETTGLSPGYQPVEIAWLEFDKDFNVIDKVQAFVNPHIPIEVSAEKVHGINDIMVLGAPTLTDFMVKKRHDQFREDRVLVVGHNVQFDVPFFAPYCREAESLCTMMLSLVVNPEAASHALGSIAELLGVVELPTHRAASDVATCFAVLRYYSVGSGANILGLLERSRSLNGDSMMPFGAHQLKLIKDLPASYRQWVLSKFQPDHWLVPILKGLKEPDNGR